MRKISTVELRAKEVVNLCGGEKLGFICDFEIDADDGRIISIIIPCGDGKLFGKREEFIIPWRCIECIGEDTVLVKIQQNELCRCECGRGKRRLF